jgi:hypothetical protein
VFQDHFAKTIAKSSRNSRTPSRANGWTTTEGRETKTAVLSPVCLVIA